MKRVLTALMCIASIAIFVACGEKKAPVVTGDAKTDQKLEQAEKKLSEMTGTEKCEATWKKRYDGKLTLDDVKPDFDFVEKLEGLDKFMGNGVNNAKAVYCKKDGSQITPEEWNAYITKIYNVTKKLAQDGKVVRGFGSNLDVKTREQALEELPLEKLLEGGNNVEWGFLRNDRFEACYLSKVNLKENSYVSTTFAEGLQKNMEEALKDAEKMLK
ncbi:MAG: hypothetical protein IKX59_04000 [Bacteroidales bacterium]|nr:hypothetical protein [Bacteroidales bacterium]